MSETLRCDNCGEVDLKDTPDVRDWLRLERVDDRIQSFGDWRERHFCSGECLASWTAYQWTAQRYVRTFSPPDHDGPGEDTVWVVPPAEDHCEVCDKAHRKLRR